MSSELRDLIRRDVERIPVPPSTEWTRRRRRRGRRGPRVALATTAGVVVIITALVGGQVLRGIRDRIDSGHTAGGVGLVPGDDLVYLADGDVVAQALQIVAMPTGRSVGRFVGETYVGGANEGTLMTVSGDFAYLPVARSVGAQSDDYLTYLQQVDLRRGIPLARIDTGTVTLRPSLQAELPGTPAFPAATATSTDGQTVWLVVDGGDRGEVTTVSRFAVPATGGPPVARSSIVLGPDQQPAAGAMRSRIVPLGNDHAAIIRDHYVKGNRLAADWYIVDAQLQVLASFAADDAHRLPNRGRCDDMVPNPSDGGWALLCSDGSGLANGAVVFLDGATFAVRATVPLDRALGVALGMATSGGNRLIVLTERPAVVRVDTRTHTFLDARPVWQPQSWLEHLLPVAAAAKSAGGSRVVFSPDAHYAYLASAPDRWWGPLSTIDLTTATVIATNASAGSIIGLGLSAGGERLYALSADAEGRRTLALLVPRTLGVASRSGPLPYTPFAILAVRPAER